MNFYLRRAFHDINNYINTRAEVRGVGSGTTALVLMLFEDRVFVANVGDCQGALSPSSHSFPLEAMSMICPINN